MDKICNRFREIREKNKMTITAVAEVIGEKRQRLQDIEAGKQKIPEDIIVKYIEYFDIDANWLLTGDGDMIKKKQEWDGVTERRTGYKTENMLVGLTKQQAMYVLEEIEEKKRLNRLEEMVLEICGKK